MGMNYSTFPGQLGGVLKNMSKYQAMIQHHLRSDQAVFNANILQGVFNQTISLEKAAYTAETDFYAGTALQALRGLFKNGRSQIQDPGDLFGIVAAGLGLSAKQFVPKGIQYLYDASLVDGTINIIGWAGALGILHQDMLLHGQYVTPCSMTPGSLTAFYNNRGQLVETSLTALSQIPDGALFYFTCQSENTSAPQFTVTMQLPPDKAWPDGTTFFQADNVLTCEKAYNDGPLGLSQVVLTRPGIGSPVLSGDASPAIFSGVSFVNPQEGDMNKGILQVRVTRQGTVGQEWLIEFFSNSQLTQKVGAKVIGGTSGTTAVTNFPLSTGTLVNFTFSMTNANTALPLVGNQLSTIAWNIQTPRIGDYWTVSVANARNGNFSWLVGSTWQWTPPTAGTTLWTDSLAAPVSVLLQ